MYSNIEAKVALAHCREGKKIYGVRMEKTSLGWKYNWAFKLTDSRAKTEGYGSTKIVGNIYPDEEYPGCPYCKAKSFIVCGTCGKLNCNNTFLTGRLDSSRFRGYVVAKGRDEP